MNKTGQSLIPTRWGTARPRFIISLVAILAFLGIVVGYIEITQSRKDIMGILQKEAETVTDALAVSAENAVQAYGEVESLVENQLFNTAVLLVHFEREKTLTQKRFEKLLTDSHVARALNVNRTGEPLGFAYPEETRNGFDSEKVRQFVTPLFTERLERTSGLVQDQEGQTYYAVAVKNTSESAWLLCADPLILLDFRKRVGIGRLIQDIGENEEIAYVVLQDEAGIISASKNVSTMPSLLSDPFSLQAMSARQPLSRTRKFEGKEVFESVKPFVAQGQVFGLIRVGLKMDSANQALTRTIERAVVVVFGFVVVGVILFNFLVTNQNYGLLTEAYSKIKTYTGSILENMADAVVAVNREGRITLFNRAAEKLFGTSSQEAMGKSCKEIIGKQTSALDQALLRGCGEKDKEVEYQLNGHKAILSVTTSLLQNSEGQIDSAVAVLKDLTEKKAYEERLRRQEKLTAMGELASGVAHEIRNPLNAISIIAQRFLHEFTPTGRVEEYRELANTVVSATQQVSSIVQRFLEFARPPELNLHRHDLNEVVRKAVTLVESEAKEKDVSVEFEVGEPMELLIDGAQMQAVLVNLLQNAVHATPSKGEIDVRLRQDDQQAVVEIWDTGVGIPPENLSRIFDLYFTTKENGTGMGLSVSHRIVSEHGGKIDVRSEVGRGTTFTIHLPIREV